MILTIDTKVDSLTTVYLALAAAYCVAVDFKITSSNSTVELTDNMSSTAPIDIEDEEFEPDDENVSPDSITYKQIAEMPCVKSGEASVEGIVREFEAMTDIKVQHAPTQPVSPSSASQEPDGVPQGSSQSVSDNELDSDGKPWDATVHSETRGKNVDGTWRKRRQAKNVEVKTAIPGLESITPNSVPAPPRERKQVRTFVYINGAQDIISAPEGATDAELMALTGKPTSREAPASSASVVPPPPPASTSSPVPPPPAAAPVVKTAPQGAPAGTFSELMERVTKYFGAQKLTSNDLVEVCAELNIRSIQECYTMPAVIPLVSNLIDKKVAAKAGV